MKIAFLKTIMIFSRQNIGGVKKYSNYNMHYVRLKITFKKQCFQTFYKNEV